jgi:Tol biopolymer transport system component
VKCGQPERTRPIVPAHPDENVGIGSATWSPDGKQIAFVRYNPPTVQDNDTHLYLVNADGTDLRETLGPAVSYPDWQSLH